MAFTLFMVFGLLSAVVLFFVVAFAPLPPKLDKYFKELGRAIYPPKKY